MAAGGGGETAGKLLVSAGVEHDAQVCLWDWRAGLPLMRQKVTTAVRLSRPPLCLFRRVHTCARVGAGLINSLDKNDEQPAWNGNDRFEVLLMLVSSVLCKGSDAVNLGSCKNQA